MIDPQEVPRFAGVPTFMRQPHRYDLKEVDADAAFLGIPFDDATTYRPGARFGPRALREASTLLKPYNPKTGTDLTDFKIVDADDVPVVPGYLNDTLEAIEERVADLITNDSIPAIVGGDHSTTLGALRAVAEEVGTVSLVQFDAHSDLWKEYFGRQYNHGTTFHNAINEGLIEPSTSIRIGDRGGLYSPDDVTRIEDSGIEYLTADETVEIGVQKVGEMIRERVAGPVYVTMDIDVLDPAFAPGTGTPMPGGLASREILSLSRELHGLDIAAFDLVELSPPYDGDGSTAILSANIFFELLCAALDN